MHVITAEPVERLLRGYPVLYKRVRRWVLVRALSKCDPSSTPERLFSPRRRHLPFGRRYMRNVLARQRRHVAGRHAQANGGLDVRLLDGTFAVATKTGAPASAGVHGARVREQRVGSLMDRRCSVDVKESERKRLEQQMLNEQEARVQARNVQPASKGDVDALRVLLQAQGSQLTALARSVIALTGRPVDAAAAPSSPQLDPSRACTRAGPDSPPALRHSPTLGPVEGMSLDDRLRHHAKSLPTSPTAAQPAMSKPLARQPTAELHRAALGISSQSAHRYSDRCGLLAFPAREPAGDTSASTTFWV